MKSKLGLIFIITAVIFSFTLFGNSKAQQANQTQEGIGTFDDRELTQGNQLEANMEELDQQQPANQSDQQQPANQSDQQQPANFTQTRDNIFETIMKYLEGNSSQN